MHSCLPAWVHILHDGLNVRIYMIIIIILPLLYTSVHTYSICHPSLLPLTHFVKSLRSSWLHYAHVPIFVVLILRGFRERILLEHLEVFVRHVYACGSWHVELHPRRDKSCCRALEFYLQILCLFTRTKLISLPDNYYASLVAGDGDGFELGDERMNERTNQEKKCVDMQLHYCYILPFFLDLDVVFNWESI